MEISIKSETDSRILIYPMIKVLSLYGTVAVYTSNKFMTRLIENELEGGFKNIRIVVNPEADLEAIKESDNYSKGKYDFTIFDNVGATDYDMLLCILTNRLSESYMQDLLYVIQDEKTHILKFGSPAPTPKQEKPKEKPAPKKKGKETEEEVEEDTNFNKWHTEKTDEDVLKEVLNDKNAKWCKFPTFDIIENIEGRHMMPVPDDGLIKEFFKLFGAKLSVDERMFMKGARVKDEGCCDIDGTDVR